MVWVGGQVMCLPGRGAVCLTPFDICPASHTLCISLEFCRHRYIVGFSSISSTNDRQSERFSPTWCIMEYVLRENGVTMFSCRVRVAHMSAVV